MNNYLLFFGVGLIVSLWRADALELLKGVTLTYLICTVSTGAEGNKCYCNTFGVLAVLSALVVCLL